MSSYGIRIPGARSTWWPWLERKFGFSQSQQRPFAFSIAPFLHDPNLSQQGYVGSGTYIFDQAGVKPAVFLLSDYGWPMYAESIDTTREMIARHPQWVASFVRASIEGWKSYLSDPTPGNKLIIEADSKQTAAHLAFALSLIKHYGFVTGGDAAKQGIGSMTDARWKEMYDFMVQNKALPTDFDYRKTFTMRFVDGLHVLPDEANLR